MIELHTENPPPAGSNKPLWGIQLNSIGPGVIGNGLGSELRGLIRNLQGLLCHEGLTENGTTLTCIHFYFVEVVSTLRSFA